MYINVLSTDLEIKNENLIDFKHKIFCVHSTVHLLVSVSFRDHEEIVSVLRYDHHQ